MTQQIQNNPSSTQVGYTAPTEETQALSSNKPIGQETLQQLQSNVDGASEQSGLTNPTPPLPEPAMITMLKELTGGKALSAEAMLEALNSKEAKNALKESLASVESRAKIDAQERQERIKDLRNYCIYLQLPEEIDLTRLASQANKICTALDGVLEEQNNINIYNKNTGNNHELGMHIHENITYFGAPEKTEVTSVLDGMKHGYNMSELRSTKDLSSKDVSAIFDGNHEGNVNMEAAIKEIGEAYGMSSQDIQLLSLLFEASIGANATITAFTAASDVTPESLFENMFSKIGELTTLALVSGSTILSDLEFASVVLDAKLEELVQFEETKNFMKEMARLMEELMQIERRVDNMSHFEVRWGAMTGRFEHLGVEGGFFHNLFRSGDSIREEIKQGLQDIAMVQSAKRMISHQVETAKDLANIALARALV